MEDETKVQSWSDWKKEAHMEGSPFVLFILTSLCTPRCWAQSRWAVGVCPTGSTQAPAPHLLPASQLPEQA